MSIVESVEDELRERGWQPVEAVHLRVGALSGVVPDALRSAYELAVAGTPFAQSRLVIEEVPVVIYCATCGADRQVQSPGFLCCPECNRYSAEIRSGRELEICALELPV